MDSFCLNNTEYVLMWLLGCKTKILGFGKVNGGKL